MEIRAFAASVVHSGDLDEKLRPPPRSLTDECPGPATRPTAPGRPNDLRIVDARDARVPPAAGFCDLAQRPRILHALLNHELQAVELFAWALLAFPDAPPDFRRGVLDILREEQAHVRLYRRRLEAYGGQVGDWPVTGYFWNKVDGFATPAHFVCAMSLTFENANLDHTEEYATAARSVGDEETAAVIDRVHDDEVGHVAFGWRWLSAMKAPDETMWDAYRARIAWPLRPALARGRAFDATGRERAGLEPEFIRRLEAAERDAS